MITRKEFEKIDLEVKNSILEIFDHLLKNCVDHDYVLFLADGEFEERLVGSPLKLNPYTIDNKEGRIKDISRLNFFLHFMRAAYSFPKGKPKTKDDEFQMTLELMIYTHIWEAKVFLKQLFRIASLANGERYKWIVEVPEMSKHEFIRKDIRDVLKTKGLKLANIITKGFHSSLRNAFAHSEYQFNHHGKWINLDTYKGEKWDIKNISYDEWTKRFAYSSLLSYHLLNEFYVRRKALPKEFKKDKFLIMHPVTERRSKPRTIFYDQKSNRFSFYKYDDE